LQATAPAAALSRSTTSGVLLALLTTLIWSGNFIIARGIMQDIPPVTLAFFRWLTATLLLLPFVAMQLPGLWKQLRRHAVYIFFTALTGVTLFNTFIYVAGHHTEAINLALIGTTSSPVISVLLARIFLKERITRFRLYGMLICISGILLLLAKGSWASLLQFRFGTGDAWVLAAGLSFAVYNILVRKKPTGINPVSFLFLLFAVGTLLLFPAWLLERNNYPAVNWNLKTTGAVLYLGLGASVISFLCWNAAIARLGAARTALFGNLIPVFSTLEAVLILNERFSILHLASGLLIISGLILANSSGFLFKQKGISK
jgi:drug/metabolite transporter (DMT)-like permease